MAILFFRTARKTQTLYKTLRSCFQVSSFVEFGSVVSDKKSKMWKVNDDGCQTTRDHKSAIEPSAQVH